MTRVISGEHRGRRLRTPSARDGRTRPTSDRTKTVLFDLLGPFAGGERVLDLYAGTGALGIEALSRGAEHATFVERAGRAVALIEANLDLISAAARAEIDRRAALDFLANEPGAWDLIVADPPYELGEAPRLVEAVDAFERLVPGGRFALEHEPGVDLPETLGTLSRIKARTVGSTGLSIYRREPDGGSA